MSALSKSILLFVLNWLDGQLTVVWVRSHIATEGNTLMGQLLKLGDAPFLFTKLAVGAFAAYVLFRCSHFAIARRGMQLVLAIYFGVMFVHAATGLSVLGWNGPEAMVQFLGRLPNAVLALLS
jgi:uncharacterized protein (DUF2062 family)